MRMVRRKKMKMSPIPESSTPRRVFGICWALGQPSLVSGQERSELRVSQLPYRELVNEHSARPRSREALSKNRSMSRTILSSSGR